MKKAILSILLAGASSVAFGQGQGELTATTTTTTATTTTVTKSDLQTTLPKPRPPQAAPLVPAEGAVQVAIRTGQPIQLINPAAPARFGDGNDRVSHDPMNPGEPKGIVLGALSF